MRAGHEIMVAIKPLLMQGCRRLEKYQLFSFNEPSEGHGYDSDVKTSSGITWSFAPQTVAKAWSEEEEEKEQDTLFSGRRGSAQNLFLFFLEERVPSLYYNWEL